MDYARQQRRPAKHLVGLSVVVGLHLVLVWALQDGLAHKVMNIAKKPIDAKLIAEAKPKELPPPPPPPPPKTSKPPPPPPDYVPPPEVPMPTAQTDSANAITAIVRAAPAPAPEPPPPAPAPKPAVRVQPVVTAASCEKPEYPAASRRLEETGTVVLRFLIAEGGRVVDSKVETSSGSPRLDEAARQALSKCKFKPGTVDGVPEQSWASMKYTWRLD